MFSNSLILFAYGQSPLFVLCIISKKRNKILKYLIFSNLLVSFISIIQYKFNNGDLTYFMLFLLGIILSLVYLIFEVVYKKKAIAIFDNDNYKEKNSEPYFIYGKKWSKISKIFAILAVIYLPLLIVLNKYIGVESISGVIMQEIIIILNYFIWSKCSKQLVNERKRLINE